MRWTDNGPFPITALMANEVEGQPWPVLVTQGNVHYFSGGTEDDDLRCIPIYAENTANAGDTGGVEYDRIEPEVAAACRAVAEVLRQQIAYEQNYEAVENEVVIPEFDAETGMDVAS